MPTFFHQPLDRRAFLRCSAKALALVAVAASPRSFANAENPGGVHLALLSDTHIPADPKGGEYRKFLPCENLKTVAAQIIAAHPDAVILSGDAARLAGEIGDYQQLKQLLAPVAAEAPVCIGLGNHDHRENFSKVFEQASSQRQPVNGKHVLMVEWPALRVILLDSLLYTDKVAGLLGKGQREWLSQHLEQSDGRATVLVVHHSLGDGDGDLLDVDRLFALIRPHRKVKAVFYGHSHEYSCREEEGIHLVNLPAVGYNFADKEPVGWVDARLTAQGAELTLRAVGGNLSANGQTTSLRWRT